MRTLRTTKLDYAQVWENTVSALASYLEKYNLQSMVLGVSGGIDSTVVASIACEVHKRTSRRLIGLSLPSNTNSIDETTTADIVGAEFCTEFIKHSINSAYHTMSDLCKDINGERNALIDGNIKARMRMIILFDASAKYNGLVLGCSNRTEAALGFCTLAGDDASSLACIGDLNKTEVYAFAHWILENIYPDSQALQRSINLTPTDGNGVQAGGDMAQIAPGHTYDDVDDILINFINYISPYWSTISSGKTQTLEPDACEAYKKLQELNDKYGADTVERVIKRHLNSAFKRLHRPLIVEAETGAILQNDYEPIS